MRCWTSGSSMRSSRGCADGPSKSVTPTMRYWCSSTKTMRGGYAGCWRSAWRSTACAYTRTRRGWWTFAVRGSCYRGGAQRGRSFTMLGFTHYWGRSRKGRWVVKRKTAKDRFSRALRGIGHWCRARRHWNVREQYATLSRKLRGHYAYYGITGNACALIRFRYAVARQWQKWLDQRGGRRRMTWQCFVKVLNLYPLPPVRVVHTVIRRAAIP